MAAVGKAHKPSLPSERTVVSATRKWHEEKQRAGGGAGQGEWSWSTGSTAAATKGVASSECRPLTPQPGRPPHLPNLVTRYGGQPGWHHSNARGPRARVVTGGQHGSRQKRGHRRQRHRVAGPVEQQGEAPLAAAKTMVVGPPCQRRHATAKNLQHGIGAGTATRSGERHPSPHRRQTKHQQPCTWPAPGEVSLRRVGPPWGTHLKLETQLHRGRRMGKTRASASKTQRGSSQRTRGSNRQHRHSAVTA